MMALVRGVTSDFDGRRINVEGVQVQVGEDRRGIGLDDGRGRGQERIRRHDHLVALADAGRDQRQPQADGAVDDRHGMLGLMIFGKALLELGDFVAGQPSPFSAPQGAEQVLFLHFAEDRPLGKRPGPQRLAAVNCQSICHVGCSLLIAR